MFDNFSDHSYIDVRLVHDPTSITYYKLYIFFNFKFVSLRKYFSSIEFVQFIKLIDFNG